MIARGLGFRRQVDRAASTWLGKANSGTLFRAGPFGTRPGVEAKRARKERSPRPAAPENGY